MVVFASLLIAADRYLWGRISFDRPTAAAHESSWWSWWDQGKYLDSARAWAAGNLDTSQHWYLPGYPLLGAPFTRLTPTQPFLVPDLICLLAALWLFAELAARLTPAIRWARSLGAVVFLITSIFWSRPLEAWVIPWSTTPTTPLTFACLIAALRFADEPRSSSAFFAALAATSIGLFRPSDIGIVLLTVVPFMIWILLRDPSGTRHKSVIVAAAVAGGLPPLLILVSAHYAIFGWQLGPYLTESFRMGFEWRLLPLRWVTIFVSPRPLFPEGYGIARVFPWIAPGIAGMAALLISGSWADRRRHVLIVAAALLHCAFYITYRDLHPQGLWRFYNFHYFKWVLPVFGLYAALLAVGLATSAQRLRMIAAGGLAGFALFFWRVEWSDPAVWHVPGDAEIRGPHELVLHHGFSSLDEGVFFRADATWNDTFLGHHELRIGDRTFLVYSSFRVFPVDGGLMLVPLRVLPDGEALVSLDKVTIDPTFAPVFGRQRIVFGLPCWSRLWCADF